jgi:uncharacterized repeat protein (TIGR03803 family)
MMMEEIRASNWDSRLRLRTVWGALMLSLLMIPAIAAQEPANKFTYHVLHKFTGGDDGGYPVSGLVRDSQGNLYGTTEFGGAFGEGTVFKLDPVGKETVLHTFTGGDGMWPTAAVVRDPAGNLFGTTTEGGTPEGGGCVHGCGTVFKIDTAGKFSVLYAFTGKADGGNPQANVILDSAGNLYGTTFNGGYSAGCFGFGCGVVFKVDHGKETVLYAFMNGADGGDPSGGLTRDKAGTLYGTTRQGGTAGWGAVYKLDPAGVETVLYSFTEGTDGGWPNGALVRDSAGNLYGEASIGGDLSVCNLGVEKGCGVVFKVDSSGKETVLYTFLGKSDQGEPNGGLMRDRKGNLYGGDGGAANGCYIGCGTVFKLDPNGKESVLHTFAVTTGIDPFGGVIMDQAGNLYGTASQGGHPGCPERDGCGTIFQLTP